MSTSDESYIASVKRIGGYLQKSCEINGWTFHDACGMATEFDITLPNGHAYVMGDNEGTWGLDYAAREELLGEIDTEFPGEIIYSLFNSGLESDMGDAVDFDIASKLIVAILHNEMHLRLDPVAHRHQPL